MHGESQNLLTDIHLIRMNHCTKLCQLCKSFSFYDAENAIIYVYLQMENIGKFLSSCEKYGVKKTDLFQSVDLFENQNMDSVIKGIVALGRMV